MNKLTKAIKYTTALATVLTVAPVSALAQADSINFKTDIDTSRYGGIVDLKPSDYLKTGISLLLGIAGIVAFLFLLIGGIQWILAGGDKEGTEKARKRITNALIGLAIVFSAYALVFIVQSLFGVDLFQLELNKLGEV